MFKKVVIGFAVAIILISAILYGCGKVVKEGTGGGGTNTTFPAGPPASNTGGIFGVVKDINGNGVSGVTVTASSTTQLTSTATSKITTTNAQGWYSLNDMNAADNLVVDFSKDGYLSTQKISRVKVGDINWVETVIPLKPAAQQIDATAGGNANDTTSYGAATIKFNANSLVDSLGTPFTGTANVFYKAFDINNDAQMAAFPGNFAGRATPTGSDKPFVTYGFVNATVSDGSQDLKLANGENVEIEMPIPTELSNNPPATIPSWYYEPVKGAWIQGPNNWILVNNKYILQAPHLTYWNCDKQFSEPYGYLSGTVVDEDGDPVADAKVISKGVNYYGSTQTWSSNDGRFKLAVIPDPRSVTVTFATKWINVSIPIVSQSVGKSIKGINSAISANRSPGPGETVDIGNLVLTAPKVQITLTWGQEPQDLDLWLTIPPSQEGGKRFPLYWFNAYYSETLSSWPSADLMTDSALGYGPEIISVIKLYSGQGLTGGKGVYRCVVNNVKGQSYSKIEESGAEVTLVIPGRTYTFKVPSTNPDPVNFNAWRVFDMQVDDNGVITAITPINDFANSADRREAFLTE